MNAREIVEQMSVTSDEIRSLKHKQGIEEIRLDGLRKQFVEAVKAGETSGDRMCDMVVCAHGFDPALVAKYRELDAALQNQAGHFVLLWFYANVTTVRRMVGGDTSESRPFYRIGVLGDGGLVREGWMIELPVHAFVQGSGAAGSPKSVTLRRENSRIFEYRGGVSPPSLHKMVTREDGWGTTLVIGDDPVRQFLALHRLGHVYAPAAEALGKLILTP